jgi:hypothetical protein
MKKIALIVTLGLTCGLSHASTITVSAGLPAQGILVSTDMNTTTPYFFSVGVWDSLTSVFTAYGTAQTITGELKGPVISTTPTSVNNQLINLFVGTARTPQESINGSYMIFGTTAGTKFPADITTSAAVTLTASSATVLTVLKNGNADNGFNAGAAPAGSSAQLNLVVVPETSTALLGALGALGLLRRRR